MIISKNYFIHSLLNRQESEGNLINKNLLDRLYIECGNYRLNTFII
jgi:hypothetical protein